MRRDPVAELAGRPPPRPFWRKFTFWLMALVICISLAGLGLGQAAQSHARSADRHAIEALREQAATAKQQANLAKAQAAEARTRTQQLQDVICGVYVPIGNSKLPPNVSSLGVTIVGATHHGAMQIHCPGLKP